MDYAELLRRYEVPTVRMVATSATRDASNRDVFFAMTAEVLGAVVPGAVAEVITGTEEAELSFRGAVHELDTAEGPFVVVDLGGGSTEVVLGVRDVEASFSADIGCVRLTERCLNSDPPTAQEVAAAREVVRDGLAQAFSAVPVERARTWVGVAGTMTTVSALAHKMTTLRLRGNSPVPVRFRRSAACLRWADCDDACATRCAGTDARGPGRCHRRRRDHR